MVIRDTSDERGEEGVVHMRRVLLLLSLLVTGCTAGGAAPRRAVRTNLQPSTNGLASDVTPVLSVGTFGERVRRAAPLLYSA